MNCVYSHYWSGKKSLSVQINAHKFIYFSLKCVFVCVCVLSINGCYSVFEQSKPQSCTGLFFRISQHGGECDVGMSEPVCMCSPRCVFTMCFFLSLYLQSEQGMARWRPPLLYAACTVRAFPLTQVGQLSVHCRLECVA